MGNTKRPVQRWEVLQVAGIRIRPGENGVMIEMTVNGAARLTRSLQHAASGQRDTELGNLFLEELIKIGRYARRASSSGRA